MGQAKQRGTFEQRLAAAKERDALAYLERKRIDEERETEWRRREAEVLEQAANDREARRQQRIAAGLGPEEPVVQSEYSAFGRRRVASSLRAGVSTASLAAALTALMLAEQPIHRKQGGQHE